VEERGLKNLPTTADALPYLQDESVKALFERTGVLSAVELESRYEVYAENYLLSIAVEAKLVADMAKTIIYPSAVKYVSELAQASSATAALGIELDTATAAKIATHCNAMLAEVDKLVSATAEHDFDSLDAHMQFCAGELCGLMVKIREHADALELEVADEHWPLPKYREMLFIK
jgi:glutamine synthetase